MYLTSKSCNKSQFLLNLLLTTRKTHYKILDGKCSLVKYYSIILEVHYIYKLINYNS